MLHCTELHLSFFLVGPGITVLCSIVPVFLLSRPGSKRDGKRSGDVQSADSVKARMVHA